ncbi:hypothetical protein COU37_00020 [Candidatus Micrarchaeota archaeon CG10_big_fil_rev_8_21_14_0_10_45_29]|nr:MAG: hypothetical protein COU37_00020 [Candidatus Micrarchaeota archaeon CG10_big_fil_rev_8_21_14_0_10_45_29]
MQRGHNISRSMNMQRAMATMQSVKEDEALWPSLLVFLGTFMMLSTFVFYPVEAIAIISLICAAIAYKRPNYAIILSLFLAMPAIAYQSAALTWIYCLVFLLIIILMEKFSEFFSYYNTAIPILQIAIFAPFTQIPFAGVLTVISLTLGALYLGSKRSLAISIPSVFFILLLSTLWMSQNSAYLSLPALKQFAPQSAELLMKSPQLMLGKIIPTGIFSIISMFTLEAATGAIAIIGKIFSNTALLLLNGALIVQAAGWAAALFLAGMLPSKLKGKKYVQGISSCAMLIAPASSFAYSIMFSLPLQPMLLAYAAIAIGISFALDTAKINLSREADISRGERQKRFGKFGLEDISGSGLSLKDVGGYQDVKDELIDAIATPLEQKALAGAYNLKPTSGILLFGPPGTGKTMIIKALAGELNMGFYYVKCSDILSSWVGESERNVAELFQNARKNSPCILFFDEMDALARKRDRHTSDDVGPRVLSVLLSEMDGFKKSLKHPVIVIGATNAPDNLDPAIMRPGRLDKIIYMHLPDAKARVAILKAKSKGLPLSDDVDFAQLAKASERFSGADLANVLNEAVRLAAREARAKNKVIDISQRHLLLVMRRIKPSSRLSDLAKYEQFKLDFERRVVDEEEPQEKKSIRLKDVIGLPDAKRAIKEAIEIPLLHEELMAEYSLAPIKGILLFGPPGCGKTMLVRAASNDIKATFLTLSGSDIFARGYTEAQNIIHETFMRAREQAPAVIFIDEIEALAPSRERLSSPVLTQLLQEIDGVSELKGVVLVGATNKPSYIDAALLRPGRFDKAIYIASPSQPAREHIFKQQLGSLSPTLAFSKFAQLSEGFSGADIVSVCAEAKMGAVRERIAGKRAKVTSEDVLRVIKGRKPSITDEDLFEYVAFLEKYGERK